MKPSLENPRYRKNAPPETELGLCQSSQGEAKEGKAECHLTGKEEEGGRQRAVTGTHTGLRETGHKDRPTQASSGDCTL